MPRNKSKSNKNNKDEDSSLDLSTEAKKFISLIDKLPYGTLLNHQGKIYYNKIVADIIGYSNNEIETIEEWIKCLHPNNSNKVIKIFESNKENIPNKGRSVNIVNKAGEQKRIKITYKRTDIGDTWAIIDETDLIEKKNIKDEYIHLLDFIKIGFWEWSIDTGLLTWDECMYEIFGIDRSKKISSYDDYKERLHPKDVNRINKEIEHIINTPGEEFSNTFRIKLNDGTIKHIRAVAKTYRDSSGRATRMVGLNWDISNEIELEENAKELIEKYEFILKSTEIGIWEWNFQNKKFTKSQTIYELYDLTKEADDSFVDLFNRFINRIHPEDRELIQYNMKRMLGGYQDSDDGEFRVISSNGLIKHIKYNTKVEKSQDKSLKRIFGIMLDISKIKEYELELVKAKELADMSSLAKSDFLANMSHEIRTPLNAIIGLTHLILDTDLSNRQRNFLCKIQKSSNSLLKIINDILDISKIEAGKVEIENVEFQIEEVLETVTSKIAQNAFDKGLEIIYDVREDVPLELIGDSLRLEQIVTNLCSNAVKFTQKGEIVVKIEKIGQHENIIELKISVIDSGIGLTESQKENIFNSYTQADISTTRNYGGTGLGLTISKKLVELLDGEIFVESEYKKGSNFSFTFKSYSKNNLTYLDYLPKNIKEELRLLIYVVNPYSRMVLSEILRTSNFDVTIVNSSSDSIENINKSNNNPFDIIFLDSEIPINDINTLYKLLESNIRDAKIVFMINGYEEEVVIDKVSNFKLDSFLIKPFTPLSLFKTISNLFVNEISENDINYNINESFNDKNLFKNKKVLLAEDNEINQMVAEELLSNVGINVDIANNGEEALQKAKMNDYDLILMDLQMPILDGYIATKRIREYASKTKLPIIAMTADAMDDVREKCLEVGMNDFITKPINPELLISILTKFLNKDLI